MTNENAEILRNPRKGPPSKVTWFTFSITIVVSQCSLCLFYANSANKRHVANQEKHPAKFDRKESSQEM